MTIDKTIEAIEEIPDNSNVEVYPASYDSEEVLASFKGSDLKQLAAELQQLREFVGSSGRMEQEYALWQLNRGESK